MFKNFKAVAHMKSPIATIDPIILDAILSAAKAKEILQEEFYSGGNKYGTKEMIEGMLDPILDKKYGVYCTSIGIGDNRESVSSWAKRWDDKDEDFIKFKSKGKQRVDAGAGHFKNYHMPLVTKSYKTITFYVRGNLEEIERLLKNYIFYLGKKSSQGFGQIKEWEFLGIEQDYSIWKNEKPMRPIPADKCKEIIKEFTIRQHPVIPPYWRKDNMELCVVPQ